MGSILIAPTSTAQWHALVNEAETACDCRLPEDMESYLVFLLQRFLTRPEMGARILATDYLESQLSAGRERSDRLREVGDHCLLFSGLFPQLAQRRRVKVSYYVQLGQSAYDELSQRFLQELYQQLAEGFVSLMDVLQTIRKMSADGPLLQPLQAMELWSETGGNQARETLAEHTSATPVIVDSRQRH